MSAKTGFRNGRVNALAAVLAGAVLAGGCVDRNSVTTVGGSEYSPGVTPALFQDPGLSDASVPIPYSAKLAPDRPSLTGLDRSNWQRVVVVSPVDGAGYRPLYATQPPPWDETARQRMEYPTPMSALDGTKLDWWDQTGGELATVGYALGDFVLFIPRMVWTPPWCGPERLTTRSYWRAPVFESLSEEGYMPETRTAPMRLKPAADPAESGN